MRLDRLLKRHFWAVISAFVVVSASFHAQALTRIIAFRVAADTKELSASPPVRRRAPVPGASQSSRNVDADTILARNPFDAVTGPLDHPPLDITIPTAASALVDDKDPMRAPECEGIKVQAIAASKDPDWSFASFSPTAGGDKMTLVRRRGGDVIGKTVQFIGWDRVWLVNGTSLCQLAMFQPPAPRGATPAATAEKKASGGGDALTREISKGIQKVSATEFKIERGVVDKILENTPALMSQVRIVPDGDKGAGMRLFGVKPDSLLGILGMENGDNLQTINGFDMTNPEKALEAYAGLRTAAHLTVAVNRKGTATNLDYDIQ